MYHYLLSFFLYHPSSFYVVFVTFDANCHSQKRQFFILALCTSILHRFIFQILSKYSYAALQWFTNYGHTMAKSLILCGQNSCSNPWLINGNMDKGLTVTKWMLINWLKIPQMPQNLYAQIVCPSRKVKDFD